MGLQERVLRELAIEYQKDKSPIVFEKILIRVEKLLLKMVHKSVKIWPHLEQVDMQDLYHSAILGLPKALLSYKHTESGAKLIQRICAYVKSEIFWSNKLTNKGDPFYSFVALEDILPFEPDFKYDKRIQTSEDIEEAVEISLFLDEIKMMLVSGVLNFEDWNLLALVYCEGKSEREIGELIGVNQSSAHQRLVLIKCKIKKWVLGCNIMKRNKNERTFRNKRITGT